MANGLYRNFRQPRWNSPRYQRAIQRIQRMSPEQRAILTPTIEDIEAGFASEDMRNQLLMMDLRATREHQKGILGLRRQELGLKKRAIKFERGQRDIANLVGWAGIPISAVSGWATLKESDILRRHLLGLQKKYEGQYR
jgi:hypothetical protein